MRFVRLPATVWRLKSGEKLSRTRYEQIVKRLAREVSLVECKRQQAKEKRGYFRAHIRLKAQPKTVYLFHNSSSGYRAQYFKSSALGAGANAYVIRALAPRLQSLLQDRNKRTCRWEWLRKSLLNSNAKIWIHQGQWLRSNSKALRCLEVDRWANARSSTDAKRRKKAIWATLTPRSESDLEIKGGYISLSGRPLRNLKPHRSREIHELGFT